MTLRASPAVWLTVATLFMVATFSLSFRWLGSSPFGARGSARIGNDIVLEDVEIRGREGSRPLWRVKAAGLTLARDRRSGAVDDLSDGVFYAQGRPVLAFAANRLSYDDSIIGAGGLFTLTGKVRIETPPAKRGAASLWEAETSQVRWRMSDYRVTCPETVRIKVDRLGSLTAKTLLLNIRDKALDAGALTLAADSGALPTALDVASSSAASPSSALAKTPNSMTVSAPEGGRWDETTQTLHLHGPVTFKQGAATMQTTGGVYDRRTKTARSESPVTLTDETSVLKGDQGTINFGTHVATLAGNIRMTVKPKSSATEPSDPEARQPATMTCDEIVYDYRAKIAKSPGKIEIRQTDRTVTANAGVYDANTRIADLVGDVVGRSDDGKVIHAPNAKVSVESGKEWIDVSGPISAEFPLDDADNPLPTKASSPAANTTKARKP